MAHLQSRREFLHASALAAAGVALVGSPALAARKRRSPNEKLNIACIGVGNQGHFSVENVKDENIVAICDVDDDILAGVAKEFPKAATYSDFRKMLERKDIDAVTIGTPDHTHAIATMWALKSGRHVYCEKPLTHTLAECRLVRETAKRHKRVTQMGTQIHAGTNYRRVVEILQSGAIGPVHEVHVWVGTNWSGGPMPTEFPPVPSNLHWDLWLGPAAERPYHPVWGPVVWRGWWAFGGGALADMACHHIDLSHWALGLSVPLSVEAKGAERSDQTCPPWIDATFEYAARGDKPPVTIHWFNGEKRPRFFTDSGSPADWGNSLFVGEKGMLLANYDQWKLLPEKDFEGFEPPKPTIPDSIGHHKEWIEACKHGGPTTCNFDYSGALTEAVLLANVSYRTGRKLEWDPKKFQCKGVPEAEQFMRTTPRKGWEF
jgi:predicted dehydrogenase